MSAPSPRSGWLALALAAAPIITVPGCGEGLGPRLPLAPPSLSEEGFDGEKIGVVFTFENESRSLLTGRVVAKSCGCLDPKFEPASCGPGEVMCLTVEAPRAGLAVTGWLDVHWSDDRLSHVEYALTDDRPGLRVFPKAVSKRALALRESIDLEFLAIWPTSAAAQSGVPEVRIDNLRLEVALAHKEALSASSVRGRWSVRAPASLPPRLGPLKITWADLPTATVDIF